MTEENKKNLLKVFNYSGFRAGQLEAINALQSGKDCLCILPTGAGKSLIYQYFSLLFPGKIVVIISPLISLMKDQVDTLSKFGIASDYCNSSQNEVEQLQVFSRAVQSKINILFLSPEKALTSFAMDMLKKMKIALLAVDEAHCISQWGHDFRPDYSKIYKIRQFLTNEKFPILALTATATIQVRKDIVESLNLSQPIIISNSFKRNNLIFNVEYVETESEKIFILFEILSKFDNGKFIIYCSTRETVEELNKLLNSRGIKSSKYHAGLTDLQRKKIQTAFSLGKNKILVATNAFGMGIDHPDVRHVVHFQVPSSIESYYQEAGRAGRDRQKSYCTLFYKSSDFNLRRFMSLKSGETENKSVLLEFIKQYCLSKDCRQVFICRYFGEEVSECGLCDNCLGKNLNLNLILEKEKKNNEEKILKSNHQFSSSEVEIIINSLKLLSGKYGKNVFIDFLRGSKSSLVLRRKLDKESYYGSLKKIPELSLKKKLDELIESGEVKVKPGKYPKLFIQDYINNITKKNRVKKELNNEQKLVREIKNFRDKEARKNKWKKYMVLQNSVILRIARVRPRNHDELGVIKGIGKEKLNKYGDIILKIIESST